MVRSVKSLSQIRTRFQDQNQIIKVSSNEKSQSAFKIKYTSSEKFVPMKETDSINHHRKIGVKQLEVKLKKQEKFLSSQKYAKNVTKNIILIKDGKKVIGRDLTIQELKKIYNDTKENSDLEVKQPVKVFNNYIDQCKKANAYQKNAYQDVKEKFSIFSGAGNNLSSDSLGYVIKKNPQKLSLGYVLQDKVAKDSKYDIRAEDINNAPKKFQIELWLYESNNNRKLSAKALEYLEQRKLFEDPEVILKESSMQKFRAQLLSEEIQEEQGKQHSDQEHYNQDDTVQCKHSDNDLSSILGQQDYAQAEVA